ncbi:MAG TPA: response regulator [Planctomycetota bacterium]|nr:response regulator [Planctomycetota bacterium]
MAILVIDRCETARLQAVSMGKWADGRQKIEQADSPASALELAVRDEPQLIMIDPEMKDTDGQSLSQRIRRLLPESVLLAFTNDRTIALENFDGSLGKPPSKIEFLRFYQLSKKRRIEKSQDKRDRHQATYKEKLNTERRMTIYVRLKSESDLCFSVPIIENATVADALRQLGKHQVAGFDVLREGASIAASEDLTLCAGDILVLRPEHATRLPSSSDASVLKG